MIDKLNIIKQRFNELSDLIIQPDIISDQKKYVKINKEYKDIKNIMDRGDVYLSLIENINEAEKILKEDNDSEMLEMAKSQIDDAKNQLPKLEEEIKFL